MGWRPAEWEGRRPSARARPRPVALLPLLTLSHNADRNAATGKQRKFGLMEGTCGSVKKGLWHLGMNVLFLLSSNSSKFSCERGGKPVLHCWHPGTGEKSSIHSGGLAEVAE